MGNFSLKVNKFIDIFINQNGYIKVVEGLRNTLTIAILGLVIGIVIGTVIATVRVIPKYKTLPKVLNSICSFYVGLFRGPPIVVQLLVFYYVMLPLMGILEPSFLSPSLLLWCAGVIVLFELAAFNRVAAVVSACAGMDQ